VAIRRKVSVKSAISAICAGIRAPGVRRRTRKVNVARGDSRATFAHAQVLSVRDFKDRDRRNL
jgi:hypothetical protein